MKPITIADALTAAAVHPEMPLEHRNRFLDVLKEIGHGLGEVVLFPVLLGGEIETK